MRVLLLIIFFAYVPTYGQNFSIKEIKMRPDKKFYSGKDTTIIYPVFTTSNPTINKLINNAIEKAVFQLIDPHKSLHQKLKEFLEDGMVTLNYKVTFKKNGLLSLDVYIEGCGAYCEGHSEYLNFDLRNGKKITTFDLIEVSKLDSFKRFIYNNIKESLIQYKNVDLKTLILEDVDPSTYFFAIESMEYCLINIKFDEFSITSNGIEFVSICPFPHAIRAYGPGDNYPYEYKSIEGFLKPEFRRRIIR
ncbi:MAG: hypothetical protein ABIT58_00230 [Ferruginibacter sp.]